MNKCELYNCPYYKQEKREYGIVCEGVHGAKTIHLNFANGKDRKKHIKEFCANGLNNMAFKKCLIYKIIEEKYYE